LRIGRSGTEKEGTGAKWRCQARLSPEFVSSLRISPLSESVYTEVCGFNDEKCFKRHVSHRRKTDIERRFVTTEFKQGDFPP